MSTALVTHGLVQKHRKSENPPFLNENSTDLRATTTHGMPLSPATHSGQETAQTIDPHLLPTARSQPPAVSAHGKPRVLHAIFESEPPTESLVATSIVTALETRQEMAGFMEKHEKVDRLCIFTQRNTQTTPETPVPSCYDATVSITPTSTEVHAKIVDIEPQLPVSSARPENSKTGSLVSAHAQMTKDGERKESGECRKSGTEVGVVRNDDEKSKIPFSPPFPPYPLPQTRFDWAEDAECIPIVHKPPRDLSILRSDTHHPFATLRRRQPLRRSLPPFIGTQYQKPEWTTTYGPIVTHRHPLGVGFGKPRIPSHTLPQNHPPKLDWDSDPRLVDLSRALRALGWAPIG
jgi:hypothetical protein